MENINEQFKRLFCELDLTDDQAAMIKKLQKDVDAALHQPPVSGSLPCHHNFIQKDTYWKSCTHCGMLAPLGQCPITSK